MKSNVSCEFYPQGPNIYKAVIKIPAFLVNRFLEHSIDKLTKKKVLGFSKQDTPREYIVQNFMQNILNNLKEFFFKYFALSTFYKEVRSKKVALIGEPRLIYTFLEQNRDAEYHFEFNTINVPITKEWKYISFKASKRKRYKDIDKQATDFIKEEEVCEKNHHAKNKVTVGDWVNFELSIVDDKNNPVLGECKENFWIKIGTDDTTLPFQEVFVGHEIGESFLTNHHCLQDFFNSENSVTYSFLITILDIAHQAFLSLENFKKHFKIKTNKKAHQKIVEVFSFTNDLSLRKHLVNEAFETLLSKYAIQVPLSTILRQEKLILDNLQSSPDYIVFRSEPGFKERVHQLAIQQTKEIALVELLAHSEDIIVEDDDLKNYLTVTQRPRTREFIHFMHQALFENVEYPVHAESLKHSTLREKALNNAIFHLTKV